jgi:His/Glu/Gln/Arg/opine family amino acid ABC transporter permease subunit
MVLLRPYLGVLLKAALLTLGISGLSLVFAILIGIVMGLIATSRIGAFRTVVRVYTEVVRSIPLLVLVFFAYYALPLLTHVSLSPYLAATISFSVYGGAYMSEVVRAGIQSISRNQWYAARSLGMGYWKTIIHIVAPQALIVVVPATIGILIDVIKGSSVASIIGFPELLQTSTNIRNVIYSLSPLFAAGFLYFGICFSLARLGSGLEHVLRYRGGYGGG